MCVLCVCVVCVFAYPSSCLWHTRCTGCSSQYAEGHVAAEHTADVIQRPQSQGASNISTEALALLQSSAKHGRRTLNVQTPAAIFILVILQIPDHFLLMMARKHSFQRASNVACDDQSGHQEHGTAIVTSPMTIWLLQGREVGHS